MERIPLLLGTIFVGLRLGPSAPAQCVNLATPGLNGCGLVAPAIPSIVCAGAPTVGNSGFGVTASIPCVASFPVLFVGTCLASPVTITGPWGAGGFCNPLMGVCIVFVGPTIYAVLPPTPPGVSFPLPIPNDPTLAGASVCVQEANICAAFAGQCIAISQGVRITIQ